MKLNSFLRKLRHSAIARIYFISSPRSLVPQSSITAAVLLAGLCRLWRGATLFSVASQTCWENTFMDPERYFALMDFIVTKIDVSMG